MRVPVVVWMLAAAGLAAEASAQSFITTAGITATLDLTWQEDPVYPHNDNGVLEVGEHALMQMTLSFTGQFTEVSISPPIGAYSSGSLRGLGAAYFDVRSASSDPTGLYNGGITSPTSASQGPNASSAGTSGYGVRGGWRLGGNVANGQPVSNGFAGIGPGQLGGPGIGSTDNPILSLYRLGWQPNSYASRIESFAVAPAPGAGAWAVALVVDFDWGTTSEFGYLPLNQVSFGSVDIPIVPTPSTVMMVLAGCGLAGRRRRREASR